MKSYGFAGLVLMFANMAAGQTATMPPHSNTFTGNTRGYWFTAPADFRITGIRVLQAPGNANEFMNWAVVHFHNNVPPPLWTSTTNAFDHLGFGFDQPAAVFAPVTIDIPAGHVIGIYGNTTGSPNVTVGANSYTAGGTQATTMIFGTTVELFRSGMQYHLGSITSPQGMHDIWADPSSQISRVEFTYTIIPSPSAATLLVGTALLAARRRR